MRMNDQAIHIQLSCNFYCYECQNKCITQKNSNDSSAIEHTAE